MEQFTVKCILVTLEFYFSLAQHGVNGLSFPVAACHVEQGLKQGQEGAIMARLEMKVTLFEICNLFNIIFQSIQFLLPVTNLSLIVDHVKKVDC